MPADSPAAPPTPVSERPDCVCGHTARDHINFAHEGRPVPPGPPDVPRPENFCRAPTKRGFCACRAYRSVAEEIAVPAAPPAPVLSPEQYAEGLRQAKWFVANGANTFIGEATLHVARALLAANEELETLREKEREYTLLRQAVNEDTGDCTPYCNSYGHAEDCKTLDFADALVTVKGQLAAAESELAALREAINGIADYGWRYDGRTAFTINCASVAEARRLSDALIAALARSSTGPREGTTDGR